MNPYNEATTLAEAMLTTFQEVDMSGLIKMRKDKP